MSSIMLKHVTRNIDRISALPDELICHILSSLRTVEVLQTMVLSKRWKNIWASVSSLDFDHKRDFNGSEEFTMVVSRVLHLRDPSGIQKLRLVIPSISHFGAFEDWIYIAVRRNVVELDLHMIFGNWNGFKLLECISMCKTLRVLRLNLGSNLWTEPPISGCCFPSLKLLHVTVFHICRTTMQYLFSCCPALEDLTIDGAIGLEYVGNGHFKVSAPELKKLRIYLETYIYPMLVYIDTPKLESIDLKSVGVILKFVLIGSVKSLVNASISFSEWPGVEEADLLLPPNFAMEIMNQVCNVKCLSFSAQCLKDHHHKDWHPSKFGNVKKLSLILGDYSCWELLPRFLKNAPNLEDFVLEDRIEGSEEFSKLQWSPPEDMPFCFSTHLKTIFLKGFKGRRVEMKMVKFLLNNSHLLKKMTISTDPCLSYPKQQELHKELMMFHRATACDIEFMYADASLGSTTLA